MPDTVMPDAASPFATAPAYHAAGAAARQRGVAGIEFGLTIMLLLMVFFAIVTYGALFWVQQALSQAAGEGARAAVVASQQGVANPGQVACQTARRSVGWLDDPAAAGASRVECESPGIACAAGAAASATCLAITVRYRADDWALIATLRGFAGLFGSEGEISQWLPERLNARAVVQIFPESS